MEVIIMKTLWICVYRDTIEEHNNDWNLTEVLVSKEIVEQYVKEYMSEYFNTLQDFLNDYTADDTQDFYDYALKHNAVIEIEHW